jgi:2-dehydropantoate 2-reductase
MKVGVIGSGAMGTIFGLAMARSGDDVLFYDVRPDLIAAIEQDGLRLEGVLGTFHLRPYATLKPEQLGVIECALVAVDANATPQAAKVVASCLSGHGFALSLQNGIGNVEALGEALGLERVVAGSTYNSGAPLDLREYSIRTLAQLGSVKRSAAAVSVFVILREE